MSAAPLPDSSIALVVTSPPYFAGKAVRDANSGRGTIPSSYVEYLADARATCSPSARVLEPGGRIAVNVANLGRKPYRSLSADVITILQDDLGTCCCAARSSGSKAEGASGNVRVGIVPNATNPVLRDLTERIIIASKGRFDRAVPTASASSPAAPQGTISKEELHGLRRSTSGRSPPRSAPRVGHPAPFPVSCPSG